MREWEKICDYLLYDDDCTEIHKIVWRSAGIAFITARNGWRFKIKEEMSLNEIIEIIKKVKQINGTE